MSQRTLRRQLAPSEHEIQASFFDLLALHPSLYVLRFFHAIPNGSARHYVVGKKLKEEGVKAGVLDTHLPVARGNYHSLWIEFKRPGETLSDKQKIWSQFLKDEGNCVEVCTSAEAAWTVTRHYLSLGGYKNG